MSTTKYQRLLKAATALAVAVNNERPNPFPGNPLDEALENLDAVVKENEGLKGQLFWFLTK